MKIVIDLSEEMIEAAKKDMWVSTLGDAVKHGIPYEVERPHGEWKWKMTSQGTYFRYGNIFCSECEYEAYKDVPVIRLTGALYNFCPNCGSDNRPRILDKAVDGEGKDGNVKEGEAREE